MKLYHLDLKITMYKKEYMKSWFRKLKANGYDGVVVEIDNKLVYPSHPEFAAPDALQADQWNDLIIYGKELGLKIHPLLQTLGHMEHVLGSSTQYTYLAENPGNRYMLCPSKEGTFNFIKDLMHDLYEIFDKPERIHLGGDEVYSHMKMKGLNKCPLCMPKDSALLLNNYLVRLAECSIDIGMRPEFWADEILASSVYLEKYPQSTVFVDWNYQRSTENDFHGTKYILKSGHEAIIASGVRSWGDSYALPRIERIMKNTGISQAMSTALGCSHLVTSWAVRLSHPETTWPGLLATGHEQTETPEEIIACLGNISCDELLLLEAAGKGIFNIDIPTEDNMRFQKPYYDDYSKKIYEMSQGEDLNCVKDMLERRVHACKNLLPVLNRSLSEGSGDRDCLRHWVSGVELSLLRTQQASALISFYTEGLKSSCLKELLERNLELVKAFEELWCESVTKYSLEQEKEIKFYRDIRILENMISL